MDICKDMYELPRYGLINNKKCRLIVCILMYLYFSNIFIGISQHSFIVLLLITSGGVATNYPVVI